MQKKIVVIGMGYVGIPAAALFADVDKFKVIGLQRKSKRSGWKIDYLNQGNNPIGGDEPGLSELIKRVVKKGSFYVTDDFSECKDSDYILIDVQTPTDNKGVPRYKSLKDVSKKVGQHLRKGTLVVIESTVAPGTTEYIVKPILEKESNMVAGKDFFLAFSYERVMVGRLIHNIRNYPRIIGGINEHSTQLAMDLYKHIVKSSLHPTDSLTAEVAKVVENTYRDVNIAFANEVGLMCESLGVNVFKVRELVNNLPNDPSNPATNPIRNMHFAGAGAGGHCLPKDPWLLKYGVDQYGRFKVNPQVIIKSRQLNMWMPNHMIELLQKSLEEKNIKLKNAKIAVLGVAFLENSDDTRNTPTKTIYEKLKAKNATPVLHDPYVKTFEYPFTKNLDEAINESDAILLMVKHKDYLKLDLKKVKNKMKTPILIDGRNAFEKNECEKIGFTYKAIGKPN